MADIVSPPPHDDGFVRKRWTVSECRTLVNTGLLTPGKFELIEGEIIFKMGQGRMHVLVIARIIAILTAIFGESVQSQAPIGVGEIDESNDPEPDVAVVRGGLAAFVDRDPDPASDILLVVEAAVTSLRGDITSKSLIYSRSGVPEYWVVAVERRQLIVHRSPGPSGYADVRTYDENEYVSPLAAPEAEIRVVEMLA